MPISERSVLDGTALGEQRGSMVQVQVTGEKSPLRSKPHSLGQNV